jgi:hypothetical protein
MSNAGNTQATATWFNLPANVQPWKDSVASTFGSSDYYYFRLSTRSSVNVTLDGLSGNADIQLLNRNGEVLQQSSSPGVTADFLSTTLNSGLYYIKVFHAGTEPKADYRLSGGVQSVYQPDLIWRNYSTGENLIWQMNGTTPQGSVGLIKVNDTNWRIEGTGDFTGDGQTDLLWRNYGTGADAGKVFVWRMDGMTGTETITVGTVPDLNWHIEGTGDFTGDGRTDILWRNHSGSGVDAGKVIVWEMNGTTPKSSQNVTTLSDPNWRIEGTGDFTRDGYVDIVLRNYSTNPSDQGRVVIWQMNSTSVVSTINSATVTDLNWRIEGTGDFTGDGQTDLVWRNYATGANQIWQMNGSNREFTFSLSSVTDLNWQMFASFSEPRPTFYIAAGLSKDTSINNGTNNDLVTSDPTISGRTNLEQGMKSLWVGVNRYSPEKGLVDVTTSVRADGSFTLNQAQLEAIYGEKLLSGILSIDLQAKNAQGQLTGTSYQQFNFDQVAPNVVVQSVTQNTTLKTGAVLAGTVDELMISRVASLGYYFDNMPVIPIAFRPTGERTATFNQAIDYTGIADGAHTLHLVSQDIAGNQAVTSFHVLVNQNLDIPVVTAVLAQDTGSSATDLYTADPTIGGTVTDANQITEFLAGFGSTPIANFTNVTTALDANGNFRFDLAQLEQIRGGVLPDERHTLHFRAKDEYNNLSEVFSLSFTLDTTAPAVPTGLDLLAVSDSGQSNSDNITQIIRPEITGHAANSLVRLYVNDNPDRQTNTLTNGNWQLAINELMDGNHVISASAIDLAGNESTKSAPLAVRVDKTAPQLSIANIQNNSVLTSGAHLIGSTQDTDLATGSGFPIASLHYYFDQSTTRISVPVPDGFFNQAIDFTGVSDGAHTLTIEAIDLAGNVTTQSYAVTVDITGSGVNIEPVLLAQLTQDTQTADDGWTYIAGISGSVSDVAQVTKLSATFDGSTTAVFQDITMLLGSDGTFSLNEEQLAALLGDELIDGVYTLRFQMQTATNQSIEKYVHFKLDRTAPESLPDLIDGIAWDRGMRLQGVVQDNLSDVQLSYLIERASDQRSMGQSSFTIANSPTGTPFDQEIKELKIGDATLAAEEIYNLILTSTDVAGNSQRTSFQFFVPGDRRVIDDDTYYAETDAGAPSTEPIPGDVRSRGYIGMGGGWGYWSFSDGEYRWTSGSAGGLSREEKDSYKPVLPTGYAYEHEYEQSVRYIVHEAINFISTSSATIHQKGALHNRYNILREIGNRLDTLIHADGDFRNDQALIEQMRPVMEGLFADAYDPAGDKAGVYPAFVSWEAAWLAQGLVQRSLSKDNPLSVREQVFQATLLEVVTEVFASQSTKLSPQQQGALAVAVMELAKTFAWLNPTPEATVPTDQKEFGFLDALWRLQIPYLNTVTKKLEFKGSIEINDTFNSSVTALQSLLAGVDDPVRAIQFINNLIQAAVNVPSLKSDVKDAQFLRELMEFGFEFVKSNPTVNSSSTDVAVQGFLDRLWRGDTQQVKQAQGGLSAFLAGMDTKDQRIKGLDFAVKLLNAAELLQSSGLQTQKHDPVFLDALVGLGGAYTLLEPSSNGQLEFFLDDIWKGIPVDPIASFEEFLQPVENASVNKVLEFSSTLLKALESVPAVQSFVKDPAFLKQYVYLARDYIRLNPNGAAANEIKNHLELLYTAKTPQDIAIAAQKLQQETMRLLESTSIGGSEDGGLSSKPFVATDDESLDLRRILTSGISRYDIPEYAVYSVVGYDQNPSQEFVIVNANDGPNYGKLVYNKVYQVGTSLGYTDDSGYTYSHAYLLRNGELYYYIEGTPLIPQPGDKLLYEKPFPVQADRGLQLSEADQAQIKSGLEEMAQFYEPLGRFVTGAVYQWAYDLGESGRVILNLLPDWQKLDLSVEEDLPKDPAFVAGRLLGNGAGAVTGLLGFAAGGAAVAGGTTLCLAPGFCLAGAPAVAAGSALAVAGAVTLKEALENAIQNASVLLSSGLNGFFSKDSLSTSSGNSSLPTNESIKQLSVDAGIPQDEAFAIREIINRRSIKKNGLMLINERRIGKFFGFPENSLPSLPEALIEKQNGKLIAVEVKNMVSPDIDGRSGALTKFKEISKIVRESNLGKQISEFHLYINKDKFEGQLRGAFSIGKGNFLFENGKIVQIDGIPVQIRFTDFKGR